LLSQLPYSPDLALANFLFPKMKMQLNGHRFQTVVEIQCNRTTLDVNTAMSLGPLPYQD
jgi:hypothetical protein